jgi:hypothetical protein
MSKFNEKDRQTKRENWLAEKGSEQEKRMIDSLLNRQDLTQQQRDMLLKYRETGNSRGMHNAGFWETAKKLELGSENYELALSRHARLGNFNTWFVAYCIANEGHLTRKDIGKMLGISDEGVKWHKQKISAIISEDYPRIEGMANDGLIARWFLGL